VSFELATKLITEGNDMEITEVKVYPANEGKLKAYATMVFDECFIVRDMKIINSDKGLFVSMPSRRKKDGSFKDIVHPLNVEMRKKIEDRLIEEYNKVVGQEVT
jgi:stage V sporulation protein G